MENRCVETRSTLGKGSTRRHTGGPAVGDVARETGVSAMTWSRGVNGDGKVRASTRAAVERAIAVLNHKPNISAQILAVVGQIRIGTWDSEPAIGAVSIDGDRAALARTADIAALAIGASASSGAIPIRPRASAGSSASATG